MRKMQFFGSFVVNLAKRVVRIEMVDNQCFYVYTSFIVRLSFVIGSFKVGKR